MLSSTEELVQVQYVFCNKTGILTENNMIFQGCSNVLQEFGTNDFLTPAMIPTNRRVLAALRQLELTLVVELIRCQP